MFDYKTNAPITADQFKDLLIRSTLGERRPVDDDACLQGMVENADVIVTAWDGDRLVGVARSVTDFNYACYLSDLAVCESVQRQGVGKILLQLTKQALGPRCNLILLAAPAAHEYYEPLGFVHNPRCWMMGPAADRETEKAASESDIVDPFDEFTDDNWA